MPRCGPRACPYTGDHAAGEAETRRLMAAGAPLIAQAVLRAPDGRMGIVDLLERVEGRSALGAYTYEPVEIKTARAIKSVYKLQLAFYGDLLADILGTWPERAHVILVDGSRTSFDLEEIRGLYEGLTLGLRAVAAGEEPPVHISSTCGDCPWELTCLPHAEQVRDISLTYGLQRRSALGLRGRGVRTLAALASLDPLEVAQWTGIGVGAARLLVTQARALDEGVAVWRDPAAFEPAAVDLYFDIEGDPEHDVLYLFGVLVPRALRGRDLPGVRRRAPRGGGARLPRAAGLPRVAARRSRVPLSPLRARRAAPAGRRHGVDPGRIGGILARLRDLHRDLVSSVVLPVYSYSLKAVAKHLGHAWRHPDAERGPVDVLVLVVAPDGRPAAPRRRGGVQRGRLPGDARAQGVARGGPGDRGGRRGDARHGRAARAGRRGLGSAADSTKPAATVRSRRAFLLQPGGG